MPPAEDVADDEEEQELRGDRPPQLAAVVLLARGERGVGRNRDSASLRARHVRTYTRSKRIRTLAAQTPKIARCS